MSNELITPKLTSSVQSDSSKEENCSMLVSCSEPLLASCYLSLIIPAYNEEKRLPATLDKIDKYLEKAEFSYELIVVDDGSSDRTRDVVNDFRISRPWIRLLHYDDSRGKAVNRGKGYAVRQGVLHACGRDILFSDADLSTPIEELEKVLPPISSGEYDMVIGSRGLPESNLVIHQPWYRELLGRSFNKIVRTIINTEIKDTQCGFKAFRGEMAKQIFSKAQIDGFGFDTELIYLAKLFGYKILEVPVTWLHADNSRVNPLLTPFSMLSELIQVRLNDMRGAYD